MQADAQNAIKSKKHKAFVVQGDEREPVDDPEGFKKAVRDFKTAIEANGGKMLLFMTWNQDLKGDFYGKLTQTFGEIASELPDLPIIPVGKIDDDCQKDPFPGKQANTSWLTYEDLHQNEFGSAVNAYATFAMLTGLDPMGIPFVAPANANTDDMLKYLSGKVWPRVQEALAAVK